MDAPGDATSLPPTRTPSFIRVSWFPSTFNLLLHPEFSALLDSVFSATIHCAVHSQFAQHRCTMPSSRLTERGQRSLIQARKCLQQITPERRPLMWAIINGICFAYSLILFIIALHYDEGSKVVKLANQNYLFFNFLTTVVWCLESTLNAFAGTENSTLLYYLQFLLATYFVGDSAAVLYQWKWKQQESEVVILDTVVNAFSYLAALMSTWDIYHRRKEYDYASLEEQGEECS